MLPTLSLILPVLIPSWRFFETIEPSPRVQWTFAEAGRETEWHDFQPRPQNLSFAQLLLRLFWNPNRSDALFVVSCAERIQQHPTTHSINAIKHRIQTELHENCEGKCLRFRLVFVRRDKTCLVQETVFTSDVFPTREPQR